jgi:beta-1,4-galactosyltransferase 1
LHEFRKIRELVFCKKSLFFKKLPENEANIYKCDELPKHMSSAVNVLKYELPYPTIFGGVTALKKEQVERVNGFSNLYFGWGGEG